MKGALDMGCLPSPLVGITTQFFVACYLTVNKTWLTDVSSVSRTDFTGQYSHRSLLCAGT